MKVCLAVLWMAAAVGAAAQVVGPPGARAVYRLEGARTPRASMVTSYELSLGPAEKRDGKDCQWVSLAASKAGGEQYRIWLLASEYPLVRPDAARYLLREGSGPVKEYRNPAGGTAVLPSLGGWEYLIPRPATHGDDKVFPNSALYLGHRYLRQSAAGGPPELPPPARVVHLRPDVLVGPPHNTRQKDETRRWDDSDYQLVPMTREDYGRMAEAGINCVFTDASQVAWAEELGLFYWGGGSRLPFPEFLYRSQYLGPVLFLDEPAVCTRDYVLRPRLAKDDAFRKAITPQIAFDAFRDYYARTLRDGPPANLMKGLAARADVDPGDMTLRQENLYSWETMVSTAAWQLRQDERVPAAMVFEPPGRIGTRRTLPELDIYYGVQLPPDDPKALTSVIFGFLRGAARAAGKNWGVSIYGQVQREDAFWWLTHAYDLGATHFFFWDNHKLACVPFGEMLKLSRHLRDHAGMHPRRDLSTLRRAAEAAILLPPGYDLGHVQMGKGNLWGIHELNLERTNRQGVKYRAVMRNFFTEIERCFKLGVAFDLLWDLPGLPLSGYSEVVRVREDGKLEVTASGKTAVIENARVPPRAAGLPPEIQVKVSGRPAGGELEIQALARVVETSAPVYYTYGTSHHGITHNAVVAWDLYGPAEEDQRFLPPDRLEPRVRQTASGWEVETVFRITLSGRYRLRAATADLAGRSAEAWTSLVATKGTPWRLTVDPAR